MAMESSTNGHASGSTQNMADLSNLVEIKNKKVIFKQKPMSLDKNSETMQEIVQFRAMLESRMEKQEGPLSTIPESFQPVIAKLAFESEKALPGLAKHIRQELLPVSDDGAASPDASNTFLLSAVEAVIKSIMTRTNYGLDPPSGTTKVPAALSVWRWEVDGAHVDWLPASVRSKAVSRKEERMEAKKALLRLFNSLPQDEQEAMFGGKGSGAATSKSPMKSKPVNEVSRNSAPPETSEKQQKPPKKEKAPDPKEIERQERKAAKAEKEKKLKAAEDKSRSLMANFFGKKPPAAKPVEAKPVEPTRSDYQRTFKPFVLKKDCIMAPINYFREPRSRSRNSSGTADDVIVVDDDDTKVVTYAPSSSWTFEDVCRRRRLSTISQGPTVRELVARLSEAEVSGDTALVRDLQAKLADRSLFPAKVFIFHQDARPGYLGTWTRQSHVIKPRAPLRKDALERDYGYDSGDDWEEEPVGDADDVAEAASDDEGGDEDEDSEMDDWLVEDDEDLSGETLLPDTGDMPPPWELPPLPAKKRKADTAESDGAKKRKVTKLVPYAKGPCWETTIGHCEHQMLDKYRIRLFNDAQLPIDPFKDVVVQPTKPPRVVKQKEAALVTPPAPTAASASSTTAPVTGEPAAQKKQAAPLLAKTTFPDEHLPALVAKMSALQTGNLTFLVESVYQDLKQYNVKKNAIEVKIRQVAEKTKGSKMWALKSTGAVNVM
ncbi:hypothetical protein CYLTODRAFT_437492 [Cylindrobasidium torrendii FP15055 ss-10]|uniref:Chromatin assembly factor 1 subunit A dimerization domain-containing protein n=1 Tax=Cylindrobasidium torrendii FP15055 ss-10 TaxID=1314674 RepID=A0A0D7B722_9AGAR|nr:hypothetical protein CYLTODRAFT_437492 [Cylindrobasidium torrendii FP15055 ss-10]